MSDLNYNINVDVEGGQDVKDLRDDVAELDEKVDNLDGTATVAVDATGVTETAEGLDAIGENTDAAGVLDDVGTAAGEAAPKADEAAGAFGEMAGAFGLVQAAGFGIDFIMDKIAEKAARIKAQDAFDAAQVQEFADALRQAGDDAANLVDTLTEGGGVTGSFRGTEFDITADLADANITADEYFRTLREDGVEGMNALITQADAAGVSEDGLQRIRLAAGETLGNLGVAADTAAASNEVFAESQASANAALQELLDNEDPMRRFADEWETVTQGIADGTVNTQAGADAINTLAVGLDLTTEEVLALAQAQVNEGVAGAQAFTEAINSTDFRNSDIAGATSAMSDYTRELFRAGNEAQSSETAFDNMTAAVGDGAFTLDVGTEAGRNQQDALEGIAGVLDGQLIQAYDDANGSQDDFVASATKLGEDTLVRLRDELGLTDEQVDQVRETLGLTAQDYEARFNLAGAAEAQIQIGLLGTAIDNLPDDVQQTVTLLILAGDYIGARDAIAIYYDENPVDLQIEAQYKFPDPAAAFRSFIGGSTGDAVKLDAVPTLSPVTTDDELLVTVVLESAVAREAFEEFHLAADNFGPIHANVLLNSRLAELNMLGFVRVAEEAGDVNAQVVLDTGQAAIAMSNFTSFERTTTVDVALGNVPSASDIRAAIGPVTVHVQAVLNTRIFGRRS